MKQKEITTGKATLLVVELPESAENIHAEIDLICLDHKEFGYNFPDYIIVKGNWQHIGTRDQMTEEVWKEVVEETNGLFPNFSEMNGEINIRHCRWETATESGLSLLKVNGVFFENPVEKYFVNKFTGENEIRIDWRQWEEKVFDPNRTHFFIKQD